jgi:hypothetical protein
MKIKKSKIQLCFKTGTQNTIWRRTIQRQKTDRQTDRQTIRLLGEGGRERDKRQDEACSSWTQWGSRPKNPQKGSKDGKFWEQNCTNMHTVRVAAQQQQQQQAEACLADGYEEKLSACVCAGECVLSLGTLQSREWIWNLGNGRWERDSESWWES